jgi:hypothetical protein
MKIHQLSLFVENRPGKLTFPCKLLAGAGIGIRTLSLADTQRFGILRLIVDDWQKAKAVLEEAGCLVKVTEVVALEVPNRPGGLSEVLQVIDRLGINIEYMYAFASGRGDRAVLIFRFDDPDGAVLGLQAAGVSVIPSAELRDWEKVQAAGRKE